MSQALCLNISTYVITYRSQNNSLGEGIANLVLRIWELRFGELKIKRRVIWPFKKFFWGLAPQQRWHHLLLGGLKQ